MPAKSRRRKGKFSPQRKQQINTAPTQTAAPVQQSVAPKESSPRPKSSAPQAPTPMAIPASYSKINTELKTIGIIGGALLIALIVIAILLS
jgi:hypothetical protein